jgi:excisionase family DNA binding protein
MRRDRNDDQLPHLEGYISVQEAAAWLQVKERTVYGYIEDGRLPAVRVGGGIAVEEEAVRAYKPKASGRPRERMPVWRLPVGNNLQYLTTLIVRLLPGQTEAFETRLRAIHQGQRQTLPGTVARYIALGEDQPDEVTLVLVWRSTVMPEPPAREAALAALRAEFAGMLDWERVEVRFSRVLMNA